MASRVSRMGTLVLAMAIALAPVPGFAIAPLLLLMAQQIAQQAATSMIKDAVLSSLSGMGCKGIALSNALSALDARGGLGLGGMPMLGGLPGLPAGMTMPNLPTGMTLPTMPTEAAGLLGGLPQGAGMPAGIPPDIAAQMAKMMPNGGQLPPGITPGSDPSAMLAQIQQTMGQPLSPPETIATIDELFELGFLPQSIKTELKECMVLVPATIPALGMGMGMMKPMIPQLRDARDQLHALSPEEQDEVAMTLVEEMQSLPRDQRASLGEYMDSGFFPPRIAAAVKTGLDLK